MFPNTIDVKLTSRKASDRYNLKINASTLEILRLILKFKLAAGWHISRFTAQKDQSRYVYMKLRRMWQAGLLESFNVYDNSLIGASLFYMLSKQGLKLLKDKGIYDQNRLKTYPKAKTVMDWGPLFKLGALNAELASMEAKNKGKGIDISFKGDSISSSFEYEGKKYTEVLTPGYTVCYTIGQVECVIYTEVEQTLKSKEAILSKIEKYINCQSSENRKYKILRFIFETPKMESAFWLNLYMNKPSLLLGVKIITTNLSLITDYKDFLGAIYSSERTTQLAKARHLKVEISERVKLFGFL